MWRSGVAHWLPRMRELAVPKALTEGVKSEAFLSRLILVEQAYFFTPSVIC